MSRHNRYLVRVWDREDDSPDEDYLTSSKGEAIDLYNQLLKTVDPVASYVTLEDLWAGI